MDSREVVFDIETIGNIKELSSLCITVVSIYQYETDHYRSFIETELSSLWPILEKADRLIGFNSEHFDLPILNKYYTGQLTQFPHLDLLKIIKESAGKRFKLDELAQATLQKKKSADGLTAVRWWHEGKVDEVKKYCEQDVLVTKELYEFGRKNKMIYYPTLTGQIVPVAVNFDIPIQVSMTTHGSGKGINLTLPI